MLLLLLLSSHGGGLEWKVGEVSSSLYGKGLLPFLNEEFLQRILIELSEGCWWDAAPAIAAFARKGK